jgi:hypothetical protein
MLRKNESPRSARAESFTANAAAALGDRRSGVRADPRRRAHHPARLVRAFSRASAARRITAAIAGVGVAVLTAGIASASPSPSPSSSPSPIPSASAWVPQHLAWVNSPYTPAPPGATVTGERAPLATAPAADAEPTCGNCVMSQLKWLGANWAFSTTHDVWYDSTSNTTLVTPVYPGGTWWQMKDFNNGRCLTLNWPANIIDETSCVKGKVSQLWDGQQCCSNQFLLYSYYLYKNDPSLCPGNYEPTITANTDITDIFMVCPQGGNGYADSNQITVANAD